MTTERQRQANRANAQKSTGPRTAAGKARSARNAVKHGLTTPPDTRSVATWYGIIRGRPSDTPDIFSSDVMEQVALRFAEAEARRMRAAEVEMEYLKRVTDRARPKDLYDRLSATELDLEDPETLEILISNRTDPREIKGLKIMLDHFRGVCVEDQKVLQRVTRHRRCAEAQCRKALTAWLKAK